MANDIDPIDDSELLYRRIPLAWYDPATGKTDPMAFAPHKDRDVSGLSLSRGKYKSIAESAAGQAGKSYYVAVLKASRLREKGIEIEPMPNTPAGFDQSHAELPALNAHDRKEQAVLEWQNMLAEELCLRVEGPFDTPPADV